MNIRWKSPNGDFGLTEFSQYFESEEGEKHVVINEIPRFVTNNNYTDSWGLQWNEFRKTQLDSYTELPLSESRLKRCLGRELFESLAGKMILEAGCGSGRFTEVLLDQAANVLSVDMSNATDANQDNFPQDKQHRIIQADILNLPLMAQQFDVVVCLGVIQHTPYPEKTIKTLYGHVKPGGWLVVDQYVYSISYYTQIAKILSRLMLKNIDPRIALKITNVFVETFLPLHGLLKQSRVWQALMRRLTPIVSYYYDIPDLSEDRQKEWALLDTFDNLTDYYKHFTTVKKMKGIFLSLEMENIWCSAGGNGVEARGTRPTK